MTSSRHHPQAPAACENDAETHRERLLLTAASALFSLALSTLFVLWIAGR